MTANADQAEFWTSESGRKWATHQVALDTLLSGVLEVVLEHAAPEPGERVLDIGCGTGASALALSDRVGPEGQVTALDISAPLLELARQRAADRDNLRFVLADAQTHDFEPGTADLLFSRFGVMFFDDPVAAFANLRRAVRPGGRLAMICWQGAPENPWFILPMKLAVERLGKPEPMDPHAPGPMAFKDIDRVEGILRTAGWTQARGTPVEADLIPPQDVAEASAMATNVGPATRLFREKEASEADVAAVRTALTGVLEGFRTEAGLRVPARLILYSAVNDG